MTRDTEKSLRKSQVFDQVFNQADFLSIISSFGSGHCKSKAVKTLSSVLIATATPKSIKRKKECLRVTSPPEGGSNPAIASVIVILKLKRKQKTEKQTRSILILT
jgi:hypothetical protein